MRDIRSIMSFNKVTNPNEIKEMYLAKRYTVGKLAEYYSVSKKTIERFLRYHNIYKVRPVKHSVNHQAFSVYNEDSAYWAGFIAADGNIGKDKTYLKVKLSAKDESHLLKLCDFIERDRLLYTEFTRLADKVYECKNLVVTSRMIVDDLYRKYNIEPNKTYHLKIPISMPAKLIRHYIRGFMDGDGSIGISRHLRVHFVSASEGILEWIRLWFVICTDSKTLARVRKRRNKTFYEFEFTGTFAKEFLDLIYKDTNKNNRLDRKYDIYKQSI